MDEQTNPDTTYHFDTWWRVYEGLTGSLWEDDDVAEANIWFPPGTPDAVPVAQALRRVYQQAEKWDGKGNFDTESAVAAVLGMMSELISSEAWTLRQFTDMADRFVIHHREMEDPLQDRLDDEYGSMPLEWLGDRGRKELEREVSRKSEFWYDQHDGSGVWVFIRPGHERST